MCIRDDAKKIVRHFLEQAVVAGDLWEQFSLQYDSLAAELQLQSGNYCRVCCQYLKELGYISLHSDKSARTPDSKSFRLTLTARAVDFLESPYLGN